MSSDSRKSSVSINNKRSEFQKRERPMQNCLSTILRTSKLTMMAQMQQHCPKLPKCHISTESQVIIHPNFLSTDSVLRKSETFSSKYHGTMYPMSYDTLTLHLTLDFLCPVFQFVCFPGPCILPSRHSHSVMLGMPPQSRVPNLGCPLRSPWNSREQSGNQNSRSSRVILRQPRLRTTAEGRMERPEKGGSFQLAGYKQKAEAEVLAIFKFGAVLKLL